MLAQIRKAVVLTAAATLIAGCATSASGTSSGRLNNVVTAEDLTRAPSDLNLHDALMRVRPTFLRNAGTAGAMQTPIAVYVGSLRMEGLDHLRQIMARSVHEVQRLEPSQANARLGGNNSGGALVVILK